MKEPGSHDQLYDSAVRITPLRGSLVDLWRYRALIRLLVGRDLTVRYKRSILGVGWTILNPLLSSLVMWLVFSHLLHSQIPGNIPFLVYLLSGVLAVSYFQQGVGTAAGSLVASASFLTKVYVPPAIFAFSSACSGAVNFLLGLIPLFVFQLVLGVGIFPGAVLIPLPLAFLLAMIAGCGLLLSTYAIRFDDMLNFLNNVVLVLIFYLTPVFYPITIVPARYQRLFYLNPMYSYLRIFRFLEYGGTSPSLLNYAVVGVTGAVGFVLGLSVFVRRWPYVAALL